MTTKHCAGALVLMTASSLAAPAWALDPLGYRTAEDLVITPILKVSERWDDNIHVLEAGAEDTFVTTVTPSVNFGLKGRKAEFNLGLESSTDIFHSSHEDDNTDARAATSLGLDFDRRNRLRLEAGYRQMEDVERVAQGLDNDIYNVTNVGALYGFGAQSARAQIEVGTAYDRLRFENTLRLSNGALLNDDRERDATVAKVVFYVALAPRTQALVEARQTVYEYTHNRILDSTNIALLTGVRWDISGKTTGSVKAGTEQKEFDEPAMGEADRSMWEVDMSWSPASYSIFTLRSTSRLEEGFAGAQVIESQAVALDWKHQWLKRLKTGVDVSSGQQDFVGLTLSSGQERADEVVAAGLSITYAMRRWLDVGVSYRFMQNDSNAAGSSYERNMVALNLTASL